MVVLNTHISHFEFPGIHVCIRLLAIDRNACDHVNICVLTLKAGDLDLLRYGFRCIIGIVVLSLGGAIVRVRLRQYRDRQRGFLDQKSSIFV